MNQDRPPIPTPRPWLSARRNGCETAEDEPLPGYARIFIYDPFGNRLELIEPDR